jgi:hypothetical protein
MHAGGYVSNFLLKQCNLTFHCYEAIAYKITITEGNSTSTIVQPLWTATLIVQALGGLF